MRLYESVFIARQDVSAQHVEALTKDFSAIIENGGGKIHKHEYWGLRALAYRVKKNRKGHYVMLNVEACLLYTSPSPRDVEESRMPSSA